jgi:hypothetical protein
MPRRIQNQIEDLKEQLKPKTELKITEPKWLKELKNRPVAEPEVLKDNEPEPIPEVRRCQSCGGIEAEIFTKKTRAWQCQNCLYVVRSTIDM